MTEKKALFITFEGGEGAGKTTLIQRLEQALLAHGRQVVRTREPGGTKLGEKIRQWLLNKDPETALGNKAELLLFLAARAQHIEELILPSLDAGKIVLCDRFNDSTVAYQGWARGLGMDTVQRLCELVCGTTIPGLTFYLDVDPETGLTRTKGVQKENAIMGQADRIESEQIQFHHKVREGFLKIAQQSQNRFIVIDAKKSADDVYAEVWQHVIVKLGLR